MKQFLITLAGLGFIASSLLSASAHAAETTANIHQGNWAVGGSLSLSNHMPDGKDAYRTFSLSVPVQYFIVDRFSVGISSNFTYTGRNADSVKTFDIGPGIKWYFLAGDRWATFVGGYFSYGNSSTDPHYFGTNADFGFYFFATPSVAFGPQFNWNHFFAESNNAPYDNLNMSIAFHVFL